MKREELIAYDKWLTRRKWGTGEIISPEKAADLYLAEHPLPPAGGAEEILANLEAYYDFKFHWIEKDRIIRAMTEFATLHAQKIADKMVSEMLREELIKYDRWMSGNYWGVKQIPTPEQSVDEYLKSREK